MTKDCRAVTSSAPWTKACDASGRTTSIFTRPTPPIQRRLWRKRCEAFDDLVRSGKVRYIGCSNYPAWQVALGLGLSERHDWARFDCVQPRV